MKVTKHNVLNDVLIIELDNYTDDRGTFRETFRENWLTELAGKPINFVQDNESVSTKDVFRGMHFQLGEFAQSKLIRVSNGAIVDIFLNIDPNSPNFGKYGIITLYPGTLLFLPNTYAHGFLSLEDNTVVNYKVDNYYNKDLEVSIKFDTIPNLFDIDKEEYLSKYIVSDKDRAGSTWEEYCEFIGINK